MSLNIKLSKRNQTVVHSQVQRLLTAGNKELFDIFFYYYFLLLVFISFYFPIFAHFTG